jgi:arsenite oxidase small subunit
LDRREFLSGSCAVIAGAAHATPTSGETRFLPLKVAVDIPLDALAVNWMAVPFKARFTKSDGNDSVIPGLAVRTPVGPVAICTYCPHELCVIKLDGQLFRCPCHFSLFDPQHDGAWISGPALRRTFRLQYETKASGLTVTGVEADLERRLL